ncbi:MAG: excinuclease ABC subunit UvrC, partial [Armatimonadetes bacterium]|nr:excinuclease ABC subunit UvrC [Armatimonadota bacterium]
MATVQKVQTTLSDKLASLPAKPGCYIYKNDKGEVLYVGKAVNLHNRVRSYFQKGAQLHPRTQRLVASVRDMEWIITDTEVEALILECTLIKKYRPFYNIRLRDDKSYPYVCVTTSEIYPRVFFTRRPHLKPDGNRYFGPYTDVRAVRDTLRTVRRIFGVQSCTHRFTGAEKMRPCLYYHLGQCLGPCTGELPPEEYRKAVDQVMMLFEGRQDEILERMNKSMEEAAENLQFERAAAMRDRIKAIQRLAQRQKVFTVEQVDQDIVGIALEGGDAVAHVFFIRAGRLVGRDNFVLDSGDDESPAEILSQFLKQYYEGAAAIPSEILLPEEPADREAILTWLGEKRGKPVRLSVPQRGEKKRLVSMVVENAQTSLEQLKKRGATGRSRSENAVLELGDALDMEVPPVRIECFDISNLQGGYTVASMTVFENGTPAKSQYRHFRIKTVEGQDDFASMREVIGRRLARAKQGDERFSDRPDLMIIDGGKGQLSAALEAVHAA